MDISETMGVLREIWQMSFSFVEFVTLFGVNKVDGHTRSKKTNRYTLISYQLDNVLFSAVDLLLNIGIFVIWN